MLPKQFTRQELLCLLGLVIQVLNTSCFSVKTLNGQERFIHNNEDVKSVAVSSTGNVFVATCNTIYQFRNNSISFDDKDSDVKIIGEISIFTLFDYRGNEYLLRCNYTSCFVHNTSNIQQVWTSQPYNSVSFGHSMGGDFSAHVVFVPCNGSIYCDLYSAISGERDTETFSERTFELLDDVFHFDHAARVSRFIKSKPGTRFEFIHSFYSDGYVYFLRNTFSTNGKRAFISQMCTKDDFFRSYMESRFECNGYKTLITAQFLQSGSSRYLIASFSGELPKYSGSIMCKFEMDMVEHYFSNGQRACFAGQNGSFPNWINGSGSSCLKTLPYKTISCGYTNENKRILFEGSLTNANHMGSFLHLKPNERMSSLLIVPYESYFIGYIGTDAGILEKVILDSSFDKITTVFTSTVSDNGANIKSLVLSSDGNHLFYTVDTKTTKTNLYTITTNECEIHSNCYSCLSDVLSCMWLQLTSLCVSGETSVVKSAFTTYCPPLVNDISPLKGPTDGGTVLTLTGLMDNPALYEPRNHGITGGIADVTVGGIPCNISDDTQYPTRLECITSMISAEGSVNITLKVNNDLTNENMFQLKRSNGLVHFHQKFVYLDPVVYDGDVRNGVVKLSGNIQLTIRGEHLDVGSNRRILIGGKRCLVDQLHNNQITCRAPRLNMTGNYTVEYEVDNTIKRGPKVRYTPEPEILNIQPLTSILSGGVTLTLSGNYLEGFGRKCQLYLENDNSTAMNASYCKLSHKADDVVLLCKTTAVQTTDITSFLAVPSLYNIYGKVKTIGSHRIHIVGDPTMNQADEILSFPTNTPQTEIKFKGSSLGDIDTNDVKITVGSTECIVKDVRDDGISCIVIHSVPVKDGLKERVKCEIGYRTYDLGTIAFQRQPLQHSTSTVNNNENNYESALVTGGVILGVVALIIVGVVLRRFKNKNQRARDDPYNVHYRRDSNILTLDGLSENHQSDTIQNRQNDYQERAHFRCPQEDPDVKETEPLLPVIDDDLREQFEQKNLIISNECLILGETIGQGHFGCVFKGYLTMPNEKAETIVACKTLHRSNPKDLDVNMFLKEALLMKDFHHHNVMELVGICLGVDKLPLVVLPFMRRGDVLSFIRDVNNKPTVKELVVFGVDIANGMHYLSQLKFVHRDLAARNCMIDENMKVKVADFGLSRDVYEKEYYSSCDKKAQLPVKWMSPESLEFGLFTHKSDVWSFGIVLWELLTRGVNPYPTVDNWDILRYLQEGRRLNKPDFCPDEMYRIMQHCWEWNPDQRPLFGDLTIRIPELLRKLERASEKRKQLETSY